MVVMGPEEKLMVLWDLYGAFANYERRVGNGLKDCIWCLLEYGSGGCGIMGDGEKLNCAFNYFSLFGFSINLKLLIPFRKY